MTPPLDASAWTRARIARAFTRVAGHVDTVVARAIVRPSLVRAAAEAAPVSPDPAGIDPFPRPNQPVLSFARAPRLSAAGADEVWDVRWGREDSPEPWARAAARLFLHRDVARSAVLLVHGYRGGDYRVERWLWPVRRLLRSGHDVALVTLPGHGVRARRDMAPTYPTRDAAATFADTRRIVGELRALLRFFRARGASVVGAAGASLGGYVVSLLATVEAELSFAVPVVPLADLDTFARGETSGPSCPSRVVHTAASPLARPSLLRPRRMVVLAAAGDRIAPVAHAHALARHFAAELDVFPGGHLLQPSHGRLLRAVDRLVAASAAPENRLSTHRIADVLSRSS